MGTDGVVVTGSRERKFLFSYAHVLRIESLKRQLFDTSLKGLPKAYSDKAYRRRGHVKVTNGIPRETIQVLRIFACGNRAGRCRLSVGFLRDLPFPPPLSFRRCSTLTSITLIGSEDLAEREMDEREEKRVYAGMRGGQKEEVVKDRPLRNGKGNARIGATFCACTAPDMVSPVLQHVKLWSSAGMKGRGKRETPRKPSDQRHRPARFQHAKIRAYPAGDWTRIDLVGGEQANKSATVAHEKTCLKMNPRIRQVCIMVRRTAGVCCVCGRSRQPLPLSVSMSLGMLVLEVAMEELVLGRVAVLEAAPRLSARPRASPRDLPSWTPTGTVCLALLRTFDAEMRGGDKIDIATTVMCVIAARGRDLKWHCSVLVVQRVRKALSVATLLFYWWEFCDSSVTLIKCSVNASLRDRATWRSGKLCDMGSNPGPAIMILVPTNFRYNEIESPISNFIFFSEKLALSLNDLAVDETSVRRLSHTAQSVEMFAVLPQPAPNLNSLGAPRQYLSYTEGSRHYEPGLNRPAGQLKLDFNILRPQPKLPLLICRVSAIRFLFPRKLSIGAESSRAFLINSDPIAKPEFPTKLRQHVWKEVGAKQICAALNIEVSRADEGEAKCVWDSAGRQGWGKLEIPQKTHRPAVSSGTHSHMRKPALLKFYFQDIPPPHANEAQLSLENYAKETTNHIHKLRPRNFPDSFSSKLDSTIIFILESQLFISSCSSLTRDQVTLDSVSVVFQVNYRLEFVQGAADEVCSNKKKYKTHVVNDILRRQANSSYMRGSFKDVRARRSRRARRKTKGEVDRSRWLRTTSLRVPALNCFSANTTCKNGVDWIWGYKHCLVNKFFGMFLRISGPPHLQAMDELIRIGGSATRYQGKAGAPVRGEPVAFSSLEGTGSAWRTRSGLATITSQRSSDWSLPSPGSYAASRQNETSPDQRMACLRCASGSEPAG
ncbi:hypothetical protein PR048_032507 [Dryococelus australis]|uniref:Uncharacterized protein n=1 Tax=Dryococelus australis TaxID=614101 RepID=A0ABQ9G2D7_9NEOP|nr:hypothetical protein PR048_032507 [Dryococelus australis]